MLNGSVNRGSTGASTYGIIDAVVFAGQELAGVLCSFSGVPQVPVFVATIVPKYRPKRKGGWGAYRVAEREQLQDRTVPRKCQTCVPRTCRPPDLQLLIAHCSQNLTIYPVALPAPQFAESLLPSHESSTGAHGPVVQSDAHLATSSVAYVLNQIAKSAT